MLSIIRKGLHIWGKCAIYTFVCFFVVQWYTKGRCRSWKLHSDSNKQIICEHHNLCYVNLASHPYSSREETERAEEKGKMLVTCGGFLFPSGYLPSHGECSFYSRVLCRLFSVPGDER